MADVAAVRITNIKTVTQGTSVYKGIRSVTITADKGQLLPILVEGNLYPTGAINAGTREFPVTTNFVVESGIIAAALLAEASASCVIVFSSDGGDKTLTIANHQFRNVNQNQALQALGQVSVSGVAYSADGTALPIAFT